MYVLEIDPPLDKKDEDGITMMPACSSDGGCIFNAVRKESKNLGNEESKVDIITDQK